MIRYPQLLERMISGGKRKFSRDHAEYVLSLDFTNAQKKRYAVLSAKATAGTLSSRESEELDELLKANALLAVMQSKVRRRLRASRQP